MLLDFFRLSINNLKHRKRRSWLTIIGTLIGIMAVVSLISIGQGLQSSVESELNRLGGNKVFISPGGGISARFSDTSFQLTEDDLETTERTKTINSAVGMISGNLQSEYRRESKFISIIGLPTGQKVDIGREVFGINIEEGRYIRAKDQSSLIMDEEIAEEKFEEEILLRSKIEIDKEYKVVGKYSSSGAVTGISGIILPMEEARKILEKPEQYDMIVGKINEGSTPQEAAEQLRENLRNERGVEEGSEDFQVRTAEDILRSFRNQLNIIRGVLLGIGSISLLVGGIGIMNTMYTSVTERTREIGVMKAIGATKKQIMTLFLIESGIIGMIGGIAGATIGIGISYLASVLIQNTIPIQFTPYVSLELIIGSVLFSFIVGTISGAVPARKAAKKEPVEALRFG